MKSFYRFTEGILLLTILMMLWNGCSTNLLKDEVIQSLTYRQGKDNKIVYYHKDFEVSDKGEITITTHHILCIGENARLVPENFVVYDLSIMKMVDFEARVIHQNGNIEKYKKGNLSTLSLSSTENISESYAKYLPIEELLTTGDLVETVEIHKMELNGLGMDFSLDQIGVVAENIKCTFVIPANDSLNYVLVNDTTKPVVVCINDVKEYTFSWKNYSPLKNKNPFEKKNTAPAIVVNNICRTWKEFGNWYLNAVKSKLIATQHIEDVAKTITTRKNDAKEKMDAIFKYCRSNVRYEEVYLEKGEFIPNLPETILGKHYGDCKDYSTLIYVMAKSVGLNPNLALCHRGRGVEFCRDIPSMQFNHVIVHFLYNDKDYWYDGTNCAGPIGINTSDLINNEALVIEEGKSRIVKIIENNDNLLKISASMNQKNKDLNGSLRIDCIGQYAVDFFIVAKYRNQKNMKEYLTSWLKNNLNENILIDKLEWNDDGDNFIIKANCTLPNSIVILDSLYFVSLGRVFSSLLPEIDYDFTNESVFYYPFYSKLSVRVDLPGLQYIDDPTKAVCLTTEVNIPSGPYINGAQKEFLPLYKKVLDAVQYKDKLVKRVSQ